MKDGILTNVCEDTIHYSDGTREVLTIKETYSLKDGVAAMECAGQLPTQLRYELMDEMLLFLVCGMKLTLDFSSVTYFSNSCQQAVIDIGARKREYGISGNFEIVNVPKEIYADLKKKHFTAVVKTGLKGEDA